MVMGAACFVLTGWIGYGLVFLRPLLTDFDIENVDDDTGWGLDEDTETSMAAVLLVYSAAAIVLSTVVSTMWFLSLLLAVSLATDAIKDTSKGAEAYSPSRGVLSDGSDVEHAKPLAPAMLRSRTHGTHRFVRNWYELVQRPCLELVNTTLPALSAAWGSTMGITFICGWAFALLNVPLAIAEFEERDNDYFRRLLLLLMVGVSAALPLLQLYAPARVSSSVLELLNHVNELRVRSEFADKFTLRRMDRANNLCKHSCASSSGSPKR